MAIPLNIGHAPRPPGRLGGMFAPPSNFGMPVRPPMPAPKAPALPPWYPWQTLHPAANPLHLARAMYRGSPGFAATLTPQMHAALFSPTAPRLPPSTLLMAGAHPGFINPGLRFGPPAL
jgi:hypothetical protein